MRVPVRKRITHSLTWERVRLELRRSVASAVLVACGVAVAVGAMSVIFGKIHVRWPWQHTETYQFALADVTGVLPHQNEVRVAGLRVGTITATKLKGGAATLTVSIDPKYGQLYRDARVKLRPQTALQDMYLDVVSRGTPAAGRLSESQPLPVTQSQGSVDVASVLDAFNGDTRVHLTQLIDELGVGLDDNGDQLKAAFVALFPFVKAASRLAGQVAVQRTATARLVHNARLITAELGRRDEQLTALIRDGSATVTALGEHERQVGETLDQLPPTLSQLRTSFATLRVTLGALGPALRSLRPTAAALQRGLSDLQRVARAADPALVSLRRPIRALLPLTRALGPTTSALSRATEALAPQTPRLNRITRRMVPCELAIQKFFAWTPSVFKFSDAHGVFPRGEAVVGTEIAGGTVHSPNLTRGTSCTDSE